MNKVIFNKTTRMLYVALQGDYKSVNGGNPKASFRIVDAEIRDIIDKARGQYKLPYNVYIQNSNYSNTGINGGINFSFSKSANIYLRINANSEVSLNFFGLWYIPE